jgi:hypothetical protein
MGEDLARAAVLHLEQYHTQLHVGRAMGNMPRPCGGGPGWRAGAGHRYRRLGMQLHGQRSVIAGPARGGASILYPTTHDP